MSAIDFSGAVPRDVMDGSASSWHDDIRAADARFLPTRTSLIAARGLRLGLQDAKVSLELVAVRLSIGAVHRPLSQPVNERQAVRIPLDGVASEGHDQVAGDNRIGAETIRLDLEGLQALGDGFRARFVTVGHPAVSVISAGTGMRVAGGVQ